MRWSLPLTRPVFIQGEAQPLTTVGAAIAYLHHRFTGTRNAAALNEIMISLALAATSQRSVTIEEATDQLEAFIGARQLSRAA